MAVMVAVWGASKCHRWHLFAHCNGKEWVTRLKVVGVGSYDDPYRAICVI